jgi:hypothetical protein
VDMRTSITQVILIAAGIGVIAWVEAGAQ